MSSLTDPIQAGLNIPSPRDIPGTFCPDHLAPILALAICVHLLSSAPLDGDLYSSIIRYWVNACRVTETETKDPTCGTHGLWCPLCCCWVPGPEQTLLKEQTAPCAEARKSGR